MPRDNPSPEARASLGGRALVAQRGAAYMAELGRRGGQATSQDRAHMAAIGRRGGLQGRHEHSPCRVCHERPARARGRCHRCHAYWARTGREQPTETQLGWSRGRGTGA
jgi:general stress protein YciG